MEREFVPKKTVTIQMTIETHRMMAELLKELNLTKTKLLEKMITEAYSDLFTKQRI